MIEYRIQKKYNDEWEFITDGHGKYYTYFTLETAKKFGPLHMWYSGPDNFRIVVCDCDWQPVEA